MDTRATGATRHALVIHNPAAGRGGQTRRRRDLDTARRLFGGRGIDTELVETRAPGDATGFGRRGAAGVYDLVVVCGGDGTLNEVVNGLVAHPRGREVPLAILPGGTANILARELNVSRDVRRAVEQIASGRTRRIAIGLATPLDQPERQRHFVCVAGAGPDGAIVRSVDLDLKRRVGIWAYWWQGAREAVRYRFPRFTVESATRRVDASFLAVGRTRHYGGPLKFTPGARLDEDAFEVTALTTQSRVRYVTYLPAAFRGTLQGRGVHRWKTDDVICTPREGEPIYAHVDGESLGALPVAFAIVPDALTLVG